MVFHGTVEGSNFKLEEETLNLRLAEQLRRFMEPGLGVKVQTKNICNRTDAGVKFQHAHIPYTVEPVLKDHPIGHKNVVCQDRFYCIWNMCMLKFNSSVCSVAYVFSLHLDT